MQAPILIFLWLNRLSRANYFRRPIGRYIGVTDKFNFRTSLKNRQGFITNKYILPFLVRPSFAVEFQSLPKITAILILKTNGFKRSRQLNSNIISEEGKHILLMLRYLLQYIIREQTRRSFEVLAELYSVLRQWTKYKAKSTFNWY